MEKKLIGSERNVWLSGNDPRRIFSFSGAAEQLLCARVFFFRGVWVKAFSYGYLLRKITKQGLRESRVSEKLGLCSRGRKTITITCMHYSFLFFLLLLFTTR